MKRKRKCPKTDRQNTPETKLCSWDSMRVKFVRKQYFN